MKIAEVRTFRVTGAAPTDWPLGRARSARPLDLYPEFRDQEFGGEQDARPQTVSHTYVEIATDDGPAGLHGPILAEQAFLVATRLRPFLIGRDPLAAELLSDQMLRLDRHRGSAHWAMAVAAVDNALWDLRGKAFGVPVCRLLGGPTRDRVEAYGSTLGASVEPDAASAHAHDLLGAGFTAQKWFFRHGPSAGAEGKRRNLALARAVREAVGNDAELMFDCFSGWDLPYAVQMAEALLPIRPKWLEEPLPADDLDGFTALKRATGIPLATGEHLYSRRDVRPLLDAGVLDYVQCDPEWCGGITELLKICAVCSAYGVQVVPHGHHVAAALHVVASQSPATCPMVEHLFGHLRRMQLFHKSPLAAEDGFLRPPAEAGLGIDLDEAKIDGRAELTWG